MQVLAIFSANFLVAVQFLKYFDFMTALSLTNNRKI
jgi:hypothetical protein